MKTQTIVSILVALLFATLLGSGVRDAVDLSSKDAIELGSTNSNSSTGDILGGLTLLVVFALSFIQFTVQGALFLNYVKVSVLKPGNNAGRGGGKLAKITFIDMDDVSYFPAPDDKGIVITDNIIFKANCYAVTIYATPNSIKLKNASSGEIDAKGVKQTVIFNHPGSEKEILEFRTAWLDRNILVIVEKCGVTAKDLYGSPCNPLQLNFEHDDDNEKNVTAFTLESTNIGRDVFKYMGTLTLETITGTIAADETDIDLTSGPGRYQLTDGSAAAITLLTCTNVVDGTVFTLLGSGGTYPSIITAANDFVLKNGTQWTAADGATITFQAYKDGSSSWKFFELSRTV